jgi:hypothetical protein
MRMRIAAVACGIVLAVIGAPAAPAAAATGTTCVNLYTSSQPAPGNEYVIARACVTWNDAPSGNNWKQTEQRIWNPPGGVNYNLTVHMYANTGGTNKADDLASGESLVSGDDFTGQYTAKFNVLVYNYSSVPFCIYLIPNGSNIEHHAC